MEYVARIVPSIEKTQVESLTRMKVDKYSDVVVFAGVNPHFIKLNHIIRNIKIDIDKFSIIFTNQHNPEQSISKMFYKIKHKVLSDKICSPNLDRLDRLDLMRAEIADCLRNRPPGLALVLGDTDSCLAGSEGAKACGWAVLHLESLGFLVKPMTIEDANRNKIYHNSDYHMYPFKSVFQKSSDIRQKMFSGDIYYDIISDRYRSGSRDLKNSDPKNNNYIFVSIHRSEMRNNFEQLQRIMLDINSIGIRVIFLVRPSMSHAIGSFRNNLNNIEFIDAVSHQKSLELLAGSSAVLTDSGGIMREAVYLGRRVVCIGDILDGFDSLRRFVGVADANTCSIMEALEAVPNYTQSEIRREVFNGGFVRSLEGAIRAV